MLIRIHLHGPYKAFHNGPVVVSARTAHEAIEGMTRQVRGFRPTVDGLKRIRVKGFDTPESLFKTLDGSEDLHVYPQLWLNEKNGNIVQVIVGTVLIVTGMMFGGFSNPFGGMLIAMGASMVIGGVMNMLLPVPKPSREDEERSKYLGAPTNTVGIGTRIAIGYGMDLWQGHFISSDNDAAELA